MASVFAQERQDLSTFADAMLHDLPPQARPREAGPACAEFIREFLLSLDEETSDESRIRFAEDQIATALIALATVGAERRLAMPWRGFGWPIIVVHGRNTRRYSALFQNALWWSWSDSPAPVPFMFPLDVPGFNYVHDALRFRVGLDLAYPQRAFELLARAVGEVREKWKVLPSVLMPRLPRWPTAGQPNPAVAVNVPGGSASIGVIGNSGGQAVGTTAAHAVGSNRTVSVGGTTCNVVQIDFVQDTATFDTSHLSIATSSTRGPLVGLAPAGGATHSFVGAISGAGGDPVIAWDAAIPWVSPTLPIQAHVYTGCVTQAGDSGAALLAASNRVVGFAHFASPAATPVAPYSSPSPGLSGWVWAEAVFASLSIV